MKAKDTLIVGAHCALKAQNAGLFVSRGKAMHPTRVIDSHELIFVKQGRLDLWEDDQSFHLAAGQALHLWPGRRHGGSKPMPLGLKFYWIHFEVEERNGNEDHNGDNDLASTIRIPQVISVDQPARLERLFRMFLDDQETGLLHPYAANMLTVLMLIELAQCCQEEKPPVTDDVNVVATWAHTYIRINYARPISTRKIAKALGYNADYLGRVYHQVYGCTLTEAIHKRRVSMACDYLLDSNLSIEQIAQKCGFTDPGYFRRIFQRYQRVSPNAYRKEYSHLHVNTN